MSAFEQKISVLQLISGIIIALTVVVFGFHTQQHGNVGIYQEEIAGSYG